MPSIQRKLQPVAFDQVRFPSGFWAQRVETNRSETLAHIYRMLEKTGRLEAFDLQFTRPVPTPIVYIFGDSDVAKWLEAASYSLAVHQDAQLEEWVDRTAERILSAQQPDGYLNTHFTHVQPEMRWKNLRDWHELYCAGHLMEAAVAHQHATQDDKLLNGLSHYADLIDHEFGRGEGQKRGYPGHPEIELALIRLYHATGNRRYLELANYFVDERGQQPHYYDLEARERGEDPRAFWAKTYDYCQASEPLREQQKVVGHAVRAMYLLAAAADLAHEKEDESLLQTCERLWDNLIQRRMYLTGGIGPSRQNEGFTEDYDLPDESAYAETCATIGLAMWNQRLLQFKGEARFADVLERGLYNGFLSGVGLDGKKFYYENPLSTDGTRHRAEWFDCPCCPPNVARVLASLGSYFYSTSKAAIWVHLYGESVLETGIPGTNERVRLVQNTKYPWDGRIDLQVQCEEEARFSLYLRLPGWCKGFRLQVNGENLKTRARAEGYLVITRRWQNGDRVRLDLEMPVRLTWANPEVRQLPGRVAIERGPLVYALEGCDHLGIPLDLISIDPQEFTKSCKVDWDEGLFGGSVILRGKGRQINPSDWGEVLYRSKPPQQTKIELTAIPYCFWDNREPGEMRVWLRTG